MNTTPNLGLTHIEANQGQKEVTANMFADGLDTAIAGSMIIELDGKIEYLLTTRQARHAILVFDGVLTAPMTVTIPIGTSQQKIHRATRGNGEFPDHTQHANRQGIILQPHEHHWIYSDGQQIYTLNMHRA